MPIEIDFPELGDWARPRPCLGDLIIKAFGNEENTLGIVIEIKDRESSRTAVTIVRVLTQENYVTEWLWAFTDLVSSIKQSD